MRRPSVRPLCPVARTRTAVLRAYRRRRANARNCVLAARHVRPEQIGRRRRASLLSPAFPGRVYPTTTLSLTNQTWGGGARLIFRKRGKKINNLTCVRFSRQLVFLSRQSRPRENAFSRNNAEHYRASPTSTCNATVSGDSYYYSRPNYIFKTIRVFALYVSSIEQEMYFCISSSIPTHQ